MSDDPHSTPVPGDVVVGSLQSRAVQGAVFTFLKYGGGQAIRLFGNLVLTRLLFAKAFGLMALISVLMQALEMFSDVGIGPSIIRSKRGDDPEFLDTIWTIQVLRGIGIWLVACALAIPFARFYDQPVMVQIIPVAAFSSVIGGLTASKRYTLNRHLHLSRVVVQELVAQASGTVVMVVLAYFWRSVWSLVIGSLVTVVARTVLSFTLLPGRNNRFRLERGARDELVGFGRWVFVSTMLTFTSQAADRLIFGKLVTIEMLGVYGIGRMLASAPTEAVGQVAMNVIFPMYSNVVTSGQELRPAFLRVRRPLLVAAGWGLALLSATGDSMIRLLYDPRYAEAGWVLQVIALGGWFNVLWGTNVSALLALGDSKWMAATTGLKTAAVTLLIPAGFWLGGFRGAVVGLAVTEAVQLALSAAIIARHGLASFWHDLPLTGLVLFSAACGFWVCSLQPNSHLLAVVTGASVVTAIWLPLGWPFLRSIRNGRAALAA